MIAIEEFFFFSGKDGQLIIQLPPKECRLVELEFTDQERAFYQAVYKRAKAKFQDLVMRGNVLRNYASVLAILLRLRQICDHPRLLTEDPEALVEKEEVTVDPMAECPFCLEPLVCSPTFSPC